MTKNQNADKYQHIDDRYFKTSSFYTAVYLICKECELIDVERTSESKRAQFVFLNNEELALQVQIFNFAKDQEPDLQVNVRTFITAIKNLKTLLYQQEA